MFLGLGWENQEEGTGAFLLLFFSSHFCLLWLWMFGGAKVKKTDVCMLCSTGTEVVKRTTSCSFSDSGFQDRFTM